MYFLIARWGGDQRQAAAWKFILYTLLGSVVMLLGLLLIGLKSGTFDMVALATDSGRGLTTSVQVIAVLAIGLGLAVKTPMWPLHSWLPDATPPPRPSDPLLLAGVLLKMGTYGFVRILLPVAPDGMRTFAPYLAAFAVVGIVYGSLACLAWPVPAPRATSSGSSRTRPSATWASSCSASPPRPPPSQRRALRQHRPRPHHRPAVLPWSARSRTATAPPTSTPSPERPEPPSTAGLPRRAARLRRRRLARSARTRGILGRDAHPVRRAYSPAEGLSRPAFRTFMAIGAFGTLLTAAYMLIVVRRVCMGEHALPLPAVARRAAPAGPANGGRTPAFRNSRFPAVRSRRFCRWKPPAPGRPPPPRRSPTFTRTKPPPGPLLVALTVLAGLWPAVLLGLTDPAVQQLLAGGKS